MLTISPVNEQIPVRTEIMHEVYGLSRGPYQTELISNLHGKVNGHLKKKSSHWSHAKTNKIKGNLPFITSTHPVKEKTPLGQD